MANGQTAPPSRRPSARQARQRMRQLGSLIEAQAALGWGLILILMALLGVIYLNQTSRTATVGRHVQNLQYQLNEIKRQNGELEKQIAEAQSLTYLQREAVRLGFIQAQPDDLEYIVVPDYPLVDEMAQPQGVGTTAVFREPPSTMADALQLAFQKRINNLMQGEARE